MGELYRLDFNNGKSYVGITVKKAANRFKHHKRDATHGSKYLVHRAWRKYGEPKMTVLAILEDGELPSTEIRAIKIFGTMTPNGYNMTPGGEESPMLVPAIKAKLVGIKRSKESRAKMSESKKGSMTQELRELLQRIHRGNSYRKGIPRPDMRGDNNPMRKRHLVEKQIASRKKNRNV